MVMTPANVVGSVCRQVGQRVVKSRRASTASNSHRIYLRCRRVSLSRRMLLLRGALSSAPCISLPCHGAVCDRAACWRGGFNPPPLAERADASMRHPLRETLSVEAVATAERFQRLHASYASRVGQVACGRKQA